MENDMHTGSEAITVNASLTRDQWSTAFLLMRLSIPMLPQANWDSAEAIIKTLDDAVEKASST